MYRLTINLLNVPRGFSLFILVFDQLGFVLVAGKYAIVYDFIPVGIFYWHRRNIIRLSEVIMLLGNRKFAFFIMLFMPPIFSRAKCSFIWKNILFYLCCSPPFQWSIIKLIFVICAFAFTLIFYLNDHQFQNRLYRFNLFQTWGKHLLNGYGESPSLWSETGLYSKTQQHRWLKDDILIF